MSMKQGLRAGVAESKQTRALARKRARTRALACRAMRARICVCSSSTHKQLQTDFASARVDKTGTMTKTTEWQTDRKAGHGSAGAACGLHAAPKKGGAGKGNWGSLTENAEAPLGKFFEAVSTCLLPCQPAEACILPYISSALTFHF